MKKGLVYHHIGIPVKDRRDDDVYLPEYKVYTRGYEKSEYGIECMIYEDDCPLPDIVKTMPHIAFQVDDVFEAIKGKRLIIGPNSPSKGVTVAFIEENGVPVEFLSIDDE